jgi:hypothetical protein
MPEKALWMMRHVRVSAIPASSFEQNDVPDAALLDLVRLVVGCVEIMGYFDAPGAESESLETV